jgi:hypothetical protein
VEIESGEREPLEGEEARPRVDAGDRLFAYYMDLLNAGEAVEKERLWSEHPEHAGELIKNLEIFLQVGATGSTRKFA